MPATVILHSLAATRAVVDIPLRESRIPCNRRESVRNETLFVFECSSLVRAVIMESSSIVRF